MITACPHTSYRFLYGTFGEHRGQTLLSLCLAANNVVGLFTVWLLVRRLLPELDGSFAFLAVVLAALCGPLDHPRVSDGNVPRRI